MRVEQVAVLGLHPLNGSAGIRITHRVAAQQLADSSMLVLSARIVGVASCDEVPHRQPRGVSQQPGAQVAKVAARHCHYGRRGRRPLLHRKEVVQLLRQPARHVDRVGRSEGAAAG
uniref:Uncharacterized protein n=1 Tax=Tanacetum cinerariifolium TaxID=118510 RepID=A0A699U4E5_TANCI|nr:hypothetical protein [Tanacetum cinerariifolium]